MRKLKIALVIFIALQISVSFSGCWNYREIDKLAIVAGVAVDKGIDGKYRLTIEIAQASGGKDARTVSKIISTEGKTMFDAARNAISLTGKRLYWSHAKIIIISKDVACEGMTKVLDWYNRDSETRNDVNILISQGNSAEEILKVKTETKEIQSFVIGEILKNQASLSKAPVITMFQFDNELQGEGIFAIAPAVSLKKADGDKLPYIAGTAVFKKDKLAGFLNSEETKYIIFIRNKIRGGVLVEEEQGNGEATSVSLEIFSSKTQVIPVVTEDKDIRMNLNIKTVVAIDEISGMENFIDDEGRKKLEENAGKMLKEQIEILIKKVQSEYDLDIFGFGAKLRENNFKEWNRVSDNWEEIFKNLEVNITAEVHIKNSALFSKPMEAGD